MWQKHKVEPCFCPVSKTSVLGYRSHEESVLFYCEDCNWTYQFEKGKKSAVPHCRGKVKVAKCGCGCGR